MLSKRYKLIDVYRRTWLCVSLGTFAPPALTLNKKFQNEESKTLLKIAYLFDCKSEFPLRPGINVLHIAKKTNKVSSKGRSIQNVEYNDRTLQHSD